MMLHPGDLQALLLTLKLAAVSTIVLLILGTPVAWWLATTRRRWRPFVDTIVALPLVLPPTVLGFYLLIVLGPNGPIGMVFSALGSGPIVFTFAVVGRQVDVVDTLLAEQGLRFFDVTEVVLKFGGSAEEGRHFAGFDLSAETEPAALHPVGEVDEIAPGD